VLKWPSVVAGIVNLIRPTTVQFIALTVYLYQAELATRCDDLRAAAKFSPSAQLGAEFQREGFLIWSKRIGKFCLHQNFMEILSDTVSIRRYAVASV